MSSSCMLLEDNDSDDEIPPSVLFVDNKKKNKRLSLSPGENNDEDPMLPTALLRLPSAPSATCTDEESMKDKEEKDAETEFKFLLSTFQTHKILSIEQVAWYMDNNKKKKKKQMVYPCFLDPESKYLPVFRKARLKPNQAVVRYFGRTKFRHQIQKVPKSRLQPFEENFEEYLDLYLKTLRGEQHGDSTTKDGVERIMFRRILDYFRNLEKQKCLTANTARKPEAEEGDYTTSSSSEEEDIDEEDNELETDPPQYETRPVVSCDRGCPVRKLRAGDYIRYCPENQVFCHNNMRETLVTEVHATRKTDDIAVSLASGEFLTRDSRVQVLKRYLNGKYKDVGSDGGFVCLGVCTLDTSLNGKVPIETLADQLSRVYNETTEEVKDMMNNEASTTTEVASVRTRNKRRKK